ncbi:hypothetical protein Bca52824_086836 [Brassica carinata]|uniref:Uncharacterized protein n=1 Tax=Brassica carinata TaxID=52824 RepID=A0A8X7PB02_BRACI|nr:hypothetical protein Bca52824_086836 [Brassica carinata]
MLIPSQLRLVCSDSVTDCVMCAIALLIETKRRKWLEDNPLTATNDKPFLLDPSIIPWLEWMKR